MSRIISRMTRGRITAGTVKKVVVSITFGALFFTGSPTPTPEPSNGGGGNGSGGVSSTISTWGKTNNTDKELQERIKLDDDLVFHIIKIWVEKCQT